jgi:hypothetical protein
MFLAIKQVSFGLVSFLVFQGIDNFFGDINSSPTLFVFRGFEKYALRRGISLVLLN